MSKSLRFGILINNNYLKKWQIDAIRRLILNHHKLELVIQNCENEDEKKSIWRKYLSKNALWFIYEKFFLRKDELLSIDYSAEIQNVKLINVQTKLKGKYSQYFLDSDVKIIKAYNLDFILRFGFNIIRGDILKVAKHGIWSFHHDDEKVIRGGPPGLWEIYNNHEVNGILLQKLTDRLDGGLAIRKAFFPVINHSYTTHLNELLKYGVDLLEFAVNELVECNEFIFQPIKNDEIKIYHNPTNIQMFILFIKLIMNRIIFNIHDLFFHEKWNIGIIQQNINELLESKKIGSPVFNKNLPRNHFFADPFIMKFQTDYHLYFENYSYKNRKGIISSARINKSNLILYDIKTLIDKPYHLAFPSVNFGKETSILAESSKTHSIISYILDENLDTIKTEFQLADIDGIDTVKFEYNGQKWIFCTRGKYGSNYHLFAYYFDQGKSEWISHKKNPIVSDARCARMAGNILKVDNQLYRVAQKNNKFYGEAIKLMKINVLKYDDFHETELFELNAKLFYKYNSGIHTLNYCDDLLIIDAKKYKINPHEFIFRLKRKLNL